MYTLFESKFKIFDSVIDVGGGTFYNLFEFENSSFKKLIGIDQDFKNQNPFFSYTTFLHENKILDFVKYNSGALFEMYKNRYEILEISLFNYNFGTNLNSFIICDKVLHFYDDSKKQEILDIFYKSLQKDGLMYLKINHILHPDYIDRNITNQICDNMYEGIFGGERRYPVEPLKFKTFLQDKYQLIYEDIDTKTFSCLIRK